MKDAGAYRTIGEVAEMLDLPQHVLRFWEGRFPQIDPLKRGGGRRYYRPDQVVLIDAIKRLLHREGYTIKGVQRLLKERGAKALVAEAPASDAGPDSEGEAVTPGMAALSTPTSVADTLRALASDLQACADLLRSAGRAGSNAEH